MSADAFVWAERARTFRAGYVARCATSTTLTDVARDLERERAKGGRHGEPDRLSDLRLLPVLEAVPAVGGKVAARRLLAAAGLADDVRLGDLDEAAWLRVLHGAGDTVTP